MDIYRPIIFHNDTTGAFFVYLCYGKADNTCDICKYRFSCYTDKSLAIMCGNLVDKNSAELLMFGKQINVLY